MDLLVEQDIKHLLDLLTINLVVVVVLVKQVLLVLAMILVKVDMEDNYQQHLEIPGRHQHQQVEEVWELPLQIMLVVNQGLIG